MSITWDPSWNIGIPVIDSQHQRWVEIFNSLERAFLAGQPMDEMQATVFKEILDYTHFHFAEEEKLMADSGYPEFSTHRRLHKDFDSLVYGHFRSHHRGETMLTSELLQLIRTWLIAHIQAEDRKIAVFLKITKEGSWEEL